MVRRPLSLTTSWPHKFFGVCLPIRRVLSIYTPLRPHPQPTLPPSPNSRRPETRIPNTLISGGEYVVAPFFLSVAISLFLVCLCFSFRRACYLSVETILTGAHEHDNNSQQVLNMRKKMINYLMPLLGTQRTQ